MTRIFIQFLAKIIFGNCFGIFLLACANTHHVSLNAIIPILFCIQVLPDLTSLDINKRREDAAMILIQEGTYSTADWWETLEHMGELRDESLVPQITPNQNSVEKSQRVKNNLRILRTELLDDVDKWDTLQHFINNLPSKIMP